jgi:hypothetical protein
MFEYLNFEFSNDRNLASDFSSSDPDLNSSSNSNSSSDPNGGAWQRLTVNVPPSKSTRARIQINLHPHFEGTICVDSLEIEPLGEVRLNDTNK